MPKKNHADVFPNLYTCFDVSGQGAGASGDDHMLYDVKAYPYPTANNEPLFAVCGVKDIFLIRIREDEEQKFELKFFKDEEKQPRKQHPGEPDYDPLYNSVVWTKDPETGKPWICIAGASPKQIQVIDVDSGDLIRTLVGHGKGISDLAISPLADNLVFSASDDYTIRLWNLDRRYEEQPCVAIFAGEGHKQPILTLDVHANGRWIISGGLDTAVCLWEIPSPEELAAEYETFTDEHPDPKTIYYPHFFSTEVHHNYVDCAVFYGDLIISRASKDQTSTSKANEILLWKIDGFDSEMDIPSEPPIAVPGIGTRSSFPHSSRSRGFQRLLTFDMPSTNLFYQRFGLLDTPGMRPILVMGNQVSKFLFWDLQRLEEGISANDDPKAKKPRSRKLKETPKPENPGLDRLTDLRRESSMAREEQASPNPSSSSASGPGERKYELSDPFQPIKPHRTVVPTTNLTKSHFATKSIAFSQDGRWMIGVGDRGIVCIFHRPEELVWSTPLQPTTSETS